MTYSAPHIVVVQPRNDRVLWIEAKRNRERIEVLSSGMEAYPDTDGESITTDQDRLQSALSRIPESLSVGWMDTYECILLLPNARLTARYLETPTVDDDQLDELIAFEVTETLQIENSEIAWDSIQSSHASADGTSRILWVAARQEYVDGFLEAWPSSLVTPSVVSTDFWGVYEVLQHRPDTNLDRPALIVLSRQDTMTFVIADREHMALMRSVRIPVAESGHDAATRWMEVRRTLTYAQSRIESLDLHSVVLVGMDPHTEEAARFAEEESITVRALTCLQLLANLSGNTESLDEDFSALIAFVACHHQHRLSPPNLLRSKVSTTTWVESLQETLQPSRTFLRYASVMAAALVVIAISSYFWYQQAVAARLDAGEELIGVARYLDKEEEGLRELIKTDFNYGDWFMFLSDTLPQRVLIQAINVNEKMEVEFSLTGANNQQALDLVNQLNDSPFFREIISDRVSVSDEGMVIYMRGQLQPGGRAR